MPDTKEQEQEEQRQRFDTQALAELTEAGKRVLMLTPELRSLVVVLDWDFENRAGLPPAIILGRDGPVRRPNEVLGLLDQLNAPMTELMNRFAAMLRASAESGNEMAAEVQQKIVELEQLDKDIVTRQERILALELQEQKHEKTEGD